MKELKINFIYRQATVNVATTRHHRKMLKPTGQEMDEGHNCE